MKKRLTSSTQRDTLVYRRTQRGEYMNTNTITRDQHIDLDQELEISKVIARYEHDQEKKTQESLEQEIAHQGFVCAWR